MCGLHPLLDNRLGGGTMVGEGGAENMPALVWRAKASDKPSDPPHLHLGSGFTAAARSSSQQQGGRALGGGERGSLPLSVLWKRGDGRRTGGGRLETLLTSLGQIQGSFTPQQA